MKLRGVRLRTFIEAVAFPGFLGYVSYLGMSVLLEYYRSNHFLNRSSRDLLPVTICVWRVLVKGISGEYPRRNQGLTSTPDFKVSSIIIDMSE